jgi:hypothetical protein
MSRPPTATVWGEADVLNVGKGRDLVQRQTPVDVSVFVSAVGNIPFDTTEAEVHALLSQIGTIKNFRCRATTAAAAQQSLPAGLVTQQGP